MPARVRLDRRQSQAALIATTFILFVSHSYAQFVSPSEQCEVAPVAQVSWSEMVAHETKLRELSGPPAAIVRRGRFPSPLSGPLHESGPTEPPIDEPIGDRTLCIGTSRLPAIALQALALGDSNTIIPPDTMGAVGPNHIVTMLNSQVRIQSRAGVERSVVGLTTFWLSLNGVPFDPKIVYDAPTGRWIAACEANADSPNSRVFLAISSSSDPTQSWTFYSFVAESSGQTWSDYTCLGLNSRWVVISNNMFTVGGDGFLGAKMRVIEKASLVAGGPLQVHVFSPGFDVAGGFGSFTLQPCVTLDAAESTIWIVDNPLLADIDGRRLLRISRLTGSTSAPVWSAAPGSNFGATGLFRVTNNFNQTLLGASQPGSSIRIDSGDPRIMNAVFRNGRIWLTHAGGQPATGSADRTSIFWYQLNSAAMPNPIVQSGIIGGAADTHHFFPSIAVNCAGDACIGFSRSASTRFVEAAYAMRRAADAAGTTGAIQTLKVGEDTYIKDFGTGEVRWGDYSATVVDPVDDRSFWTFQEYAETGVGPTSFDDRWGVWVTRLLVVSDDCNANGISDATDIANATSRDCNSNGIPDECDIQSGYGTDCDANGIIDVCEVLAGRPDCNHNNVPDSCDISSGNSPDCNGNGVPDECDVVNGNATDCNGNGIPDACELVNGSATDCDGNGRLDVCDLAPSALLLGITTGTNPRTPIAMAMVNLNGAGAPEFAIIDAGPNPGVDARLRLLRWNGVALSIDSTVTIGTNPTKIVTADFNNDGLTDIAIADDQSTPGVNILLNDGSGHLLAPLRYAAARADVFVAGDFNGDGNVDLFTMDDSSNTQPRLSYNLGGGVFAPAQILSFFTAGGREGVGVDVDLDGRTDVVIASDNSNYVNVLRNRGDGTFDTPRHYVTGTNPQSVTVAFLNDDRFPDLVVACEAERSDYVLINRGDGTFEPAVPVTVADRFRAPHDVAVCDLNQDGIADLISTLPAIDQISVVLGVTPTEFLPPQFFNVGDYPFSIEAGDFDNDGDPDLVVSNQLTPAISAVQNFTQAPRARDCNLNGRLDSCDIASGDSVDLDGDGVPDECRLDCNANGIADDAEIALGLAQDCDGNFIPDACEPDCNGNGMPDSCDIRFAFSADCNHNGLPDECDTDCNGNGIPDDCDLSPGPIAFTTLANFSVTSGIVAAASADIDLDGDLDLICIGSSTNIVLFTNNAGTFLQSATINGTNQIFTITADDVNGDGAPDLLIAYTFVNSIGVFLNSGNGSFSAAPSLATNDRPRRIAVGDIDDDADTDIVVACFGTFSQSQINIFRSAPTGFVAEVPGLVFGQSPSGWQLVDVDGDGDLDIVGTAYLDQQLFLFRNNGTGSFASAVIVDTLSNCVDMVAGDFDGDGDPDVAIANSVDSSVFIYRNIANGVFVLIAQLPMDQQANWVLAADLDGDGDLDLVAGEFLGYACHFFANDGSGKFHSTGRYEAGVRTRPALIDLNGDGRLDLVSCGDAPSATRFYTALNSTPPPAATDCNGNHVPDVCEWIPGDANADGTVNLTDLSLLLAHYGASGVDRQDGDFDGDGDADLTDLSMLLSNFGRDCP